MANAKELLASLIEKSKPEERLEETQKELTPEQIAAMATQPESHEAATAAQEAQKQEALQQQQSDLQKQVEQDLATVEMNLEDALKEIRAANTLVEKAIEKADESIEKLEKKVAELDTKDPEIETQLKAQKEKKEKLEELDEKVAVAEVIVNKVVEDLKTLPEVPEKQVEKAEEAVEDLREALAAVMEVDAAVPEVEQKPTKEHTEQAVEEVKAAQEAMQAAAEGMAEMKEIGQILEMMGSAQTLSGHDAIARQRALGTMASALSGKWLDITEQMRGRNLNQEPLEVPAELRPELWENKKQLNLAPSTRKVITDSDRGGDWIFIGDWYVLSRYDNARRANREKVYPPESILDLDARYLSEDGQPMRWEYASFLPPMIRPYGAEPWKIYYFYTELYFEEASEAWLAIGSDDRSDVWINDLPVWHSSNEHKVWNPAEGFRKVYFEKGRNKVLVRLENGQNDLGFSLYMRLDRAAF